jgi:hypothetical protein
LHCWYRLSFSPSAEAVAEVAALAAEAVWAAPVVAADSAAEAVEVPVWVVAEAETAVLTAVEADSDVQVRPMRAHL